MRTHKIVEAIPVLKLSQIEGLGRMSKGDCFDNFKGSFDYALPQGWLNDFADWCKANPNKAKNVTYDIILATTVWAYDEKNMGEPCTCCAEVDYAFRRYVHYATV